MSVTAVAARGTSDVKGACENVMRSAVLTCMASGLSFVQSLAGEKRAQARKGAYSRKLCDVLLTTPTLQLAVPSRSGSCFWRALCWHSKAAGPPSHIVHRASLALALLASWPSACTGDRRQQHGGAATSRCRGGGGGVLGNQPACPLGSPTPTRLMAAPLCPTPLTSPGLAGHDARGQGANHREAPGSDIGKTSLR